MFDRQACLGEAPVEQVGSILNLLEFAFDDPDESVQVGHDEVGRGPLEQ
ncbi:hypothetical protein [Nonomuraea sp. NPDC048916]